MKNYLKSIKNLRGEGTIWGLALRRRKGACLYDGNYSEFTFIKNSIRYWRADPFLFEYNGETYLFAELFDRIKGKGIIGVAEIKNGKCGKFRECLSLPYHLSYPCVYQDKDEIYMVPECARSGRITVYKSRRFPNEWEEAFVLYEGAGVDTTPVRISDSERGFFTTLRTKDHQKNNCLFYIGSDDRSAHLLLENDLTLRSAGHVIRVGGRILRPSQDCEETYGGGLYFKRINALSADRLEESNYRRIDFSDIKTDSTIAFNGIHTYNQTERYEVIDLSYDVGKSISFLIKKIRKHFVS